MVKCPIVREIHICQVPSFSRTDVIGAPQGEAFALMIPWSSNSWICLWTSANSNNDCLYKPTFGNWNTCNWISCSFDWVSCCTPHSGGNPLGYWKTSMNWFIKMSHCFLCLLVWLAPQVPASRPIPSALGFNTKIKIFLLTLINLFTWLVVTREIFCFPLYTLMGNGFPFLKNLYFWPLIRKIVWLSHM